MSVGSAVMKTVRPHQWLKNALVFVPLAAAHMMDDTARLLQAMQCFAAFCLCASSLYVLNDFLDRSADRLHPHKRERPLAAGSLSVPVALSLSVVLLLAAFAVAALLGFPMILTLASYVVLMTAYSLGLKNIAMLDVLILAGGYALRVVAGGAAVRIAPSPWLVAFCVFLFLSLALVKRCAELRLLRRHNGPTAHARGYQAGDETLLEVFGVASGYLSVLVLALYTSSAKVERLYAHPQVIWLTCALLLYWLSHVWLTTHRGRMLDDPVLFALRDPLSRALVFLMGISAWTAV